jgi:YegS/Rv2252/BmrU family lipid kinase
VRHRLPEVERRFAAAHEGVKLLVTEGPGHATVLARDALERGADVIVSIGGDGTTNEILAGFVDERGDNLFPDVELAVIACGTGSDFQRHLGRRDVSAQLDAVVDGRSHRVDYGVARLVSRDGQPLLRPFLNEASVGLSGHVVDFARRTPRILGQRGTYLVSALRSLVAHRDKGVTLILDDGIPRELPLTLAVVANGQYFGGGMWIAPEARCDDGWFDVLYTGGHGKLHFLGLLARVFRGTHTRVPGVATARSRTIQMVPRDDRDVVLIDLDGEQPGRLPASFHIVPRGLLLRAAGLHERPIPRESGLFAPVEPSPRTPLLH